MKKIHFLVFFIIALIGSTIIYNSVFAIDLNNKINWTDIDYCKYKPLNELTFVQYFNCEKLYNIPK